MNERQSQAAESAELLRRVAARDEEAATEIFERYAERLIGLARSRLAAKLAAKAPISSEAVSHRDSLAAAFRALSKAVFAWLVTSETRFSASV